MSCSQKCSGNIPSIKVINAIHTTLQLTKGGCGKLQLPQSTFEMFELSLSFKQHKGACEKLKLPQSTLILDMRGLFEENPLVKNCGITLERGNS